MRREGGVERRKKFMVYLIAFVMIGSTFGVIFFGYSSGTGSIKYGDFKFVNKGGFWSANVNGIEALFTYLPNDVEPINISGSINSKLKNRLEIDVTSDFNDTFADSIALSQYQMGIALSNFNVFVRGGFAGKNPANFTIITCNDATDFVPVIYFKTSNATNVFLKDNCIIAEAASKDGIIRVKDRLVYGMLGIIQ